ncbi:MAG: PE-PPE domain-containing protein, partial [Mycobacterium sp.]
MARPQLRSPGNALLALAGAAAVGVTSVLTVFGVKTLNAEAALLAGDVGWIMGGTGLPDPTVGDYISQVESLYLQPFSAYSFQGLETPEEFCPPVCFPGPPDHPEWTNLNFGDSLNVGVQQLDGAIRTPLADGTNVAVLGYSQSATLATQEMNDLIANAGTSGYPTVDQLANLHVVLLGDPNNPIGGILDRFQFPDGVQAFSLSPEAQHLPFLNVPLGIAPTPTDTMPTDIYTGEYDGYANFPQDPTNILADINALVGIET